jgi:hypothetical protein
MMLRWRKLRLASGDPAARGYFYNIYEKPNMKDGRLSSEKKGNDGGHPFH